MRESSTNPQTKISSSETKVKNKTLHPVFSANSRLNKSKVAFSRIKRKILKHVWVVRGVLLGMSILLFYLFFLGVRGFLGSFGENYYYRMAKSFIFPSSAGIKTYEGRTNILILGKGGAGHDAPDLTDTIIFASVSQENPRVTLLSLPRDIWVPSIRAKLNSAYYWGNQKQAGGGLVLAKSLVEEIVGEQIEYAVVVDFSGFRQIIDVLGGVEVDVERGFRDEKYPIPGKENDTCGGKDPLYKCRYETLVFREGKQMMDGETALKYSRSRNAEGDEGTDLARAARQEKILQAIKAKAMSKEVLSSPRKMAELLRVTKETTETDLEDTQLAALTRIIYQAKDNLKTYVLGEEMVVNPPLSAKYDRLYVFVAKDGSWDSVHDWVDSLLQ